LAQVRGFTHLLKNNYLLIFLSATMEQLLVSICVVLLVGSIEAYRTSPQEMIDKATAVMRSDDPPMSLTPSTTVHGCKCQSGSKCGATINSTYSCDWCRVEGGSCGTKSNGRLWTRKGNWDYCAYPQMDTYEAQTASAKMTQLWNKVTHKDVVGRSGPAKSVLGVVSTLIGESMRTTFDTHWDVLPEGRTKVIHSQGVHCQFELDIPESPFTGLLAAGKQAGIIRMGSASSLDKTGKPPFPGLSFKFLRSGVQSGNFVALRATGPEGGGYAFFDQAFSKIVNPPAALQALMKFDQASQCVSMVGLSDIASYAQDGRQTPANAINFPYDITFEASSDQVYIPNEKMSDEDMYNHLSAIRQGTHLFDVYAKASPTAEKAFLGKLTTTSSCVKSVFGDQNLFFRHQRMEEDFVKKPEWTSSVTAPGCKAAAVSSSKWQCPGVH